MTKNVSMYSIQYDFFLEIQPYWPLYEIHYRNNHLKKQWYLIVIIFSDIDFFNTKSFDDNFDNDINIKIGLLFILYVTVILYWLDDFNSCFAYYISSEWKIMIFSRNFFEKLFMNYSSYNCFLYNIRYENSFWRVQDFYL